MPVPSCPILVLVLLRLLLGLAARRATVGPAGLGTVLQQGNAKAGRGGWGGHFPMITVPATVAQVIADISQRVVCPRRIQPWG